MMKIKLLNSNIDDIFYFVIPQHIPFKELKINSWKS